jgi:hypothetical protein
VRQPFFPVASIRNSSSFSLTATPFPFPEVTASSSTTSSDLCVPVSLPRSWVPPEPERLLFSTFVLFLFLLFSACADCFLSLQVLANRKTVGVIGGDRLVAGRVPGREFQRGTAYVEQQDTHEHTQTVREAFRFSAYLRQPSSVSKEEKDRYVR